MYLVLEPWNPWLLRSASSTHAEIMIQYSGRSKITEPLEKLPMFRDTRNDLVVRGRGCDEALDSTLNMNTSNGTGVLMPHPRRCLSQTFAIEGETISWPSNPTR